MAAISQEQPSAAIHSHYCQKCENTGRDYKELSPSSWSMQFQDLGLVASFKPKSEEGKKDSKAKSNIQLPDGETYILYCFETGSTRRVDNIKINTEENCAKATHSCGRGK